jgi:Ca-activated chloride channel family protein
MSFLSPVYLLAALAVPLMAAAYAVAQRRRRRFPVRFPAAAVLAGVVGRTSRWRRAVPAALLAAGAVFLAVAMARPQRVVAIPVEKASVMLVTDESGSMSAADVQPSRLDAARDAATRFLDGVPDSLLVGFVAYSSGTNATVSPSTAREDVKAELQRLVPDGGTATGDALTAALDQLEARKGRDGKTAPSAILLLSDGKTTRGSDPAAAAARARKLGIPVYTVALGTDSGTVTDPASGQAIPVPPDPQTLSAIARDSGGQAFQVSDADELGQVYQRLGSRIGTRKVRREVGAAFASAALLLLAGGVGTGLRWRGRLA